MFKTASEIAAERLLGRSPYEEIEPAAVAQMRESVAGPSDRDGRDTVPPRKLRASEIAARQVRGR